MANRLTVSGLSVKFPLHGGVLGRVVGSIHAVKNVSFELKEAEILAVVGESGCGKSTLANALVGLVPWQTGGVYSLNGQAIATLSESSFRKVRDQVQMVFQDPFSSLNPRQTIGEILSYPLLARGVSRAEVEQRMGRVLDQVGLAQIERGRFPHAFSGGQRQRIGIARALMLRPQVLICDEITSALDVSVQAQILVLVEQLRQELGLSVLFISHDLSVVRALADQVLVMYQGEIVESGPTPSVLQKPAHPYTQALLHSVPTLDRSKPPQLLSWTSAET